MESESGVKHLIGAIILNSRRSLGYAVGSSGASLFVTIPLILSEMSLILGLGLFDLWGAWFNREGINIIAGDYVSMSHAKQVGTELRWSGRAAAQEHREVGVEVKTYISEAARANREGDLPAVVELTHAFVRGLIQREDNTQSLFAMHRHVLESVGIAALNGISYAQASGGRTRLLTRCFVTLQLYAVLGCGYFDRAAQKCHQRGVGIIENDVPYIPFLEAYADYTKGT